MLFGRQDITALPMHKRARLGIGYLPQEASIFRKLTVRQNFTAVLEALDRVFALFPRLENYVLDDQRRLRRHVVIFVDGERVWVGTSGGVHEVDLATNKVKRTFTPRDA